MTLVKLNPSQLSASERIKLENRLDLQLTFPAWEYGNVDKETGMPTKKQVFVSCKLVTEVNPDEKTALRFSFMTSQSVKIDSPIIDAKTGKYIKVASETYLPAIVYDFGYVNEKFVLTVTSYSNLLFAKGGNLMEYPEIERRDELASLVESIIDDNKVEFIKTYIDNNGKERILNAYDDTVLILKELKQRSHLETNDIKQLKDTTVKYKPIPGQQVIEAFVDAYNQSKACLPNTVLDNYYRYAQHKLKEIEVKSIESKPE